MTEPLNPEQPTPGYRKIRLTPGGPFVAARIMESEGLWLVLINGVPTAPAAMANAWAVPRMEWTNFGKQIDEAEYRALLAAAAEATPGSPLADPTQAVDLRAAKSLY